MSLIEGGSLRNNSTGANSLGLCYPLNQCIRNGGHVTDLTFVSGQSQGNKSLGNHVGILEATHENRSKLKKIWPNQDIQFQSNHGLQDGHLGRPNQSVSLSAAKVVTLKDRLANTKKHLQQFPSIPDSQISFGYNFDSQQNKMIPNGDPQVLISQIIQEHQPQNVNPGRYFFARNPGTIGEKITQLNWRKEKSERSPLSLLHQINYPDSTNYRSEDYNTIAYAQKRSPQQTSACFASSSPRLKDNDEHSKREALLANKMKKDFASYINKESTQYLTAKEGFRGKQKHVSTHEEQSSGKAQYFLSKSPRFSINTEVEIDTGITEQEACQRETTKEPFSLGSSRFCLAEKQKLGPGYYETKMNFTEERGGLIKQNSPRFRASEIVLNTPGPGAYCEIEPKKFKSTVRLLDRDQNRQSGCKMACKETSMQIMYSQFGKQVNLFKRCKAATSKVTVKKTSQINKTNFQKARRKLQEIVNREAKEPEKERVVKQSSKPFFQHLYSFGLRSQLGSPPLQIASAQKKQSI